MTFFLFFPTTFSVNKLKVSMMTRKMLDFIFLLMWKVIHVTQIHVKMMGFAKMENAHAVIDIAGTFVKLKRIFANCFNV